MTLKEQMEMIQKEMEMYDRVAERTAERLKRSIFNRKKKTSLIAFCQKRKTEYAAVLDSLQKCVEE